MRGGTEQLDQGFWTEGSTEEWVDLTPEMRTVVY